jgi:hypothetical protein
LADQSIRSASLRLSDPDRSLLLEHHLEAEGVAGRETAILEVKNPLAVDVEDQPRPVQRQILGWELPVDPAPTEGSRHHRLYHQRLRHRALRSA